MVWISQITGFECVSRVSCPTQFLLSRSRPGWIRPRKVTSREPNPFTPCLNLLSPSKRPSLRQLYGRIISLTQELQYLLLKHSADFIQQHMIFANLQWRLP